MKLFALVIDDDDVVSFIHRTLLLKTGAVDWVHVFDNGLPALDYLHENSSDKDCNFFILIDINMPVMNGWEFLSQLNPRLLKRCVGIYILSSSIDRNDIDRAKEIPVVEGFLHKPFNLATAKRVCAQIHSKLQNQDD